MYEARGQTRVVESIFMPSSFYYIYRPPLSDANILINAVSALSFNGINGGPAHIYYVGSVYSPTGTFGFTTTKGFIMSGLNYLCQNYHHDSYYSIISDDTLTHEFRGSSATLAENLLASTITNETNILNRIAYLD